MANNAQTHRAERTRQMVLIRFDSCSSALGIPHPAAPPPLATWSRTGCRERSNGQAYCFDRGKSGNAKNAAASTTLNVLHSTILACLIGEPLLKDE